MKKGLILYVLGDKEVIHEEVTVQHFKHEFGVDLISLAFSESDIAFMCWLMLTCGVQIISCLKTWYEPRRQTFMARGNALRLYG